MKKILILVIALFPILVYQSIGMLGPEVFLREEIRYVPDTEDKYEEILERSHEVWVSLYSQNVSVPAIIDIEGKKQLSVIIQPVSVMSYSMQRTREGRTFHVILDTSVESGIQYRVVLEEGSDEAYFTLVYGPFDKDDFKRKIRRNLRKKSMQEKPSQNAIPIKPAGARII